MLVPVQGGREIRTFGGRVARRFTSSVETVTFVVRRPLRSSPARREALDLVVEKRVDHVDVVAREPMLVQHPSGALFLAGYGMPQPTLWTSRDLGATWSRVELGIEATGNSDVDLAVATDGTLYFVTMSYERQVNEGRGISIGVSRDAGATWSWTAVSRSRFDDRPWVEVAPHGTAHLIWNDGGGVKHRVSNDGGRSWTTPPPPPTASTPAWT
jgi:hypothetical protein